MRSSLPRGSMTKVGEQPNQMKLMTFDPATPYRGSLRFLQIISVDKNTDEVTAEVIEGRDMLKEIYERTTAFTDHVVGKNVRNLKDFNVQSENFIVRAIIASLVELGEFAQRVPFKWWGRGSWQVTPEEREKLIEEVVDELHFAFARLHWLSVTTEELYEAYIKKNDLNWERFKGKIGWNKVNE